MISLPGQVDVSRHTIRYMGTSRDFYVAETPRGYMGIRPGVGPTGELAVADLIRNYLAHVAEENP